MRLMALSLAHSDAGGLSFEKRKKEVPLSLSLRSPLVFLRSLSLPVKKNANCSFGVALAFFTH